MINALYRSKIRIIYSENTGKTLFLAQKGGRGVKSLQIVAKKTAC